MWEIKRLIAPLLVGVGKVVADEHVTHAIVLQLLMVAVRIRLSDLTVEI
jgi:hypothetical protein